jgi:uncharacterized membrane protein YphA (DoxX/SURF4 family)
MKKWRMFIGWIGLTLVSLMFLQAGVLKLIGDQRMIDTFNLFGYQAWFRILIGSMEVIGSIALFIRLSSRYAALLLASIMIGAIVSGLMAGQSGGAVLEVILLCCLIWIAVTRKPRLPRKLKHETLDIQGG